MPTFSTNMRTGGTNTTSFGTTEPYSLVPYTDILNRVLEVPSGFDDEDHEREEKGEWGGFGRKFHSMNIKNKSISSGRSRRMKTDEIRIEDINQVIYYYSIYFYFCFFIVL